MENVRDGRYLKDRIIKAFHFTNEKSEKEHGWAESLSWPEALTVHSQACSVSPIMQGRPTPSLDFPGGDLVSVSG